MRVLFICLAAMILVYPAGADTIVLKSGSTIEATVIERTTEKVIVDIQGVPITYYLSDIESINNASVNSKTVTEPQSADVSTVEAGEKGVAEEFNAAGSNEPQDEQTETISEATQETSPETTTQTIQTTTTRATGSETLESAVQRAGHPRGETVKPTLNVLDKAGWATFMGMFAGFFVIFIVLLAGVYIFSALCLQIIATKTAAEPSWLAWIPFANVFLMCKIGGLPYWWCFALLAPFIPFIGGLILAGAIVFMWYKIAIARGKPGWLGILTIIPLANLVIMGYLAFSD